MRPTTMGAWLALVLSPLVAEREAWAGELLGTGPLAGASVAFTEHAELRYYHVDDKLEGFEDRWINDYLEQLNRLTLVLAQPTFTAGLQADEVGLFSNRYILNGELYHSWPLYGPSVQSPFDDALFQIEKIYATKKGPHVEASLGDVYASYGRGIALSVVKNTDLDQDTSIRGARVDVHGGDTNLSVVSGLTNSQQIAMVLPNLGIAAGRQDMVAGLRFEQYALGPANVGAHGVAYTFERADDAVPGLARYSDPVDALVGGATVELPGVAGVDWYGEGDVFDYRAEELGGSAAPLGRALYGSGSFYPGRTVVLIEAKDTRDTELLESLAGPVWEVATTPTLEYERVITEDSIAAVNSNNVTGGRARVDYALKPGVWSVYGALMGLRDRDTEGLHFNQSPETVGHLLAGTSYIEGHHSLQLNAGLRRDVRDAVEEGYDQLAHADVAFEFPVFSDDGIEFQLAAKHFWWGHNVAGQEDFTESENAISYRRGEHWVFVLDQDYSNNPLVDSTGNLSKDAYGALEVLWKPQTATTFRAFAGATKAGIRCSGGQCRKLPGFDGVKVSVDTVF